MSSTSQNRSVAAAADLIEAERTLAALPLARRGDGDREVLIALVNAVLSIAASLLGNGQTSPGKRRSQSERHALVRRPDRRADACSAQTAITTKGSSTGRGSQPS